MTDTFYQDYFKGLAENLKAIGHVDDTHEAFFVIEDMDNMQEVQEAIRRRLKTPALLLEDFEDDLTDENADNNQERLIGAFSVIIRVEKNDTLLKRSAKADARKIAREIVFEMKRNTLNGLLADNGIICKIQSKGFGIGPVADNCYGWRYSFMWMASMNTVRDAGDWNT
ncbi:MAG: hypothetical protein WBP45_15765 [Daejeonella sp.]